MRIPLGRRGGLVALAALAFGCGAEADPGRLTVTTPSDGTTELRAYWPYSSFEVDVTLTVVTRITPEGCSSTGTLTVDEALSSKSRYELAPTDCSALELTAEGDIVMHADPTRHNWVAETLSVDTDAEVVSLGPATGTDADGEPQTFTFTLSSPPCADQPACSCGLLRRSSGAMHLDLPLGKRC